MREQNYATLADYQPWPIHDPGWFMLEWDVALDRCDRERFMANAFEQPERVRVAPYMLYPDELGPRPQQVHRWGGAPIPDGKPEADSVGFGCIYFPQAVLDDLWSGPPPRRLATQGVLNDVVFSEWYRARYKDIFDVDWTVRPQHLHGD